MSRWSRCGSRRRRRRAWGSPREWSCCSASSSATAAVLLRGAGGSYRPNLLLLVGAFACLATLIVLEQRRPQLSRRLLIAATGALLVLAVVVPPVQSNDLWLYAAYGRMVSQHGTSPYEAPPSRFRDDPLLPRVDRVWRGTRSLYGPGFIALAAAGTAATGDSALAVRLLFQGLAAAAVLVALLLVDRRTKRPGRVAARRREPAGGRRGRQRGTQRRADRAGPPGRCAARDAASPGSRRHRARARRVGEDLHPPPARRAVGVALAPAGPAGRAGRGRRGGGNRHRRLPAGGRAHRNRAAGPGREPGVALVGLERAPARRSRSTSSTTACGARWRVRSRRDRVTRWANLTVAGLALLLVAPRLRAKTPVVLVGAATLAYLLAGAYVVPWYAVWALPGPCARARAPGSPGRRSPSPRSCRSRTFPTRA